MSRRENDSATRVVATIGTEKNYFRKDLKAEAVSIGISQAYTFDIKATEGKRLKYISSQLVTSALSGNVPAPTAGNVVVYVQDCATLDGIDYVMNVALCTFAYNGTLIFEKNQFASSQTITISPTNEVVLADNVNRLQASKNGFMRIRIVNLTNQIINFATLGSATFALISEEELIS